MQPLPLLQKDKTHLLQIGISVCLIGLSFTLEQLLNTGWLPQIIICATSISYFIHSCSENHSGSIITSAILTGCWLALFWFVNGVINLPLLVQIGLSLMSIGGGFLLIVVSDLILEKKISWWAFFVGWVLVSNGIPFLTFHGDMLFFILCSLTGVGSGLLLWGLGRRLLGLIIPGSILASIGAGVYAAWSNVVSPNGLTETGILLVWFALGWGAIIIFARVITTKYIWWPLIPGGILAVVGWGLYSGGSPNNALSFIGNTGSIGVLIFGLYLLLVRRGMKG